MLTLASLFKLSIELDQGLVRFNQLLLRAVDVMQLRSNRFNQRLGVNNVDVSRRYHSFEPFQVSIRVHNHNDLTSQELEPHIQIISGSFRNRPDIECHIYLDDLSQDTIIMPITSTADSVVASFSAPTRHCSLFAYHAGLGELSFAVCRQWEAP